MTPIIRWNQTENYDILHYAQIHSLGARRKGDFMSDLDAQILKLFHQLTLGQKKVIILSVILSSLASEQEAFSLRLALDPEDSQ